MLIWLGAVPALPGLLHRRGSAPCVPLRRGHRLGRGQAALFEKIEAAVAPMREHYLALIAEPRASRSICTKAPPGAGDRHPFLGELRRAVACAILPAWRAAKAEKAKAVLPQFKQ